MHACYPSLIKQLKILHSTHFCLYIIYFSNSTNAISIECVIQDIDCIHTTYKEINTNKNDTTVFIHGYQGNKESLPVQYMVSGILLGYTLIND